MSRFITFDLADEELGSAVVVDPNHVTALFEVDDARTAVCFASGRAFEVRGSCAEVARQLEGPTDRASDRVRRLEDRVEALERGLGPLPPGMTRRVVR